MFELFAFCLPFAMVIFAIECGPRIARYIENRRIDRELYGDAA